MAQQTRKPKTVREYRRKTYVSALRKRDIKEVILFGIGCQPYMSDAEGSIRIKEQGEQASLGEIKKILKSRFVTDKGVRGIRLPRRTLHNYLEDLMTEGHVKRLQKGIYGLTEAGMEELGFLKDLWKGSRQISLIHAFGPFFLLGRDENGRTAYVNIMIRITNPEAVQAIEEAITKNKISENREILASLLATVVMWDVKGLLSRSKTLMEGKEDVILQILNSLPFTEAN